MACVSKYFSDAHSFSCKLFTGIVVTNDGNAILRELDVAHPAAKVLVSLASFH